VHPVTPAGPDTSDPKTLALVRAYRSAAGVKTRQDLDAIAALVRRFGADHVRAVLEKVSGRIASRENPLRWFLAVCEREAVAIAQGERRMPNAGVTAQQLEEQRRANAEACAASDLAVINAARREVASIWAGEPSPHSPSTVAGPVSMKEILGPSLVSARAEAIAQQREPLAVGAGAGEDGEGP